MKISREQVFTPVNNLRITAGKRAAILLLSAGTALSLTACKSDTAPAPKETHSVVVQSGDTLSQLVDEKCGLDGNWGQIQDGITETVVSNNMPGADIGADSKINIVCPPKE